MFSTELPLFHTTHKPMPSLTEHIMVYALVYMNITDPDRLATYREKAGAALNRHGGSVAGSTSSPTRLEGALPLPDIAAVLSFPDRAAAVAWIEDPEIAEVHALRRASTEGGIILVG